MGSQRSEICARGSARRIKTHLFLLDGFIRSALMPLDFVLQPRPLLLDLADIPVLLGLELLELVALLLGFRHRRRRAMFLPRNLVLGALALILDLLDFLILLIEGLLQFLDGVALLGLSVSEPLGQIGDFLLQLVDPLLLLRFFILRRGRVFTFRSRSRSAGRGGDGSLGLGSGGEDVEEGKRLVVLAGRSGPVETLLVDLEHIGFGKAQTLDEQLVASIGFAARRASPKWLEIDPRQQRRQGKVGTILRSSFAFRLGAHLFKLFDALRLSRHLLLELESARNEPVRGYEGHRHQRGYFTVCDPAEVDAVTTHLFCALAVKLLRCAASHTESSSSRARSARSSRCLICRCFRLASRASISSVSSCASKQQMEGAERVSMRKAVQAIG